MTTNNPTPGDPQYPPPYGPPPGYGPAPGYGPQQGYVAQPSSATAIIAAVLAFLGGLAAAVGAISGFVGSAVISDIDDPGWFAGYIVTEGVVSLVRLGVLVAGGVLLLRRRSIGRSLVLVGCVLTVVMGIIGVAIVQGAAIRDVPGAVGYGAGAGAVMLFPIVTAILVLIPPTTRWLKSV